jgi:uroporphyrinogen-III synthase
MKPNTSAAPLAGRRVLVTRAAHQAGKLSDGLRALGAEPVEVPVLEIRPPQNLDSLDHALRRLAGSSNDPGCPRSGFSDLGNNESQRPSSRISDDAGCPRSLAFGDLGNNEPTQAQSRPTNNPAYDWLIFTSANTVRAVVERAAALGISFAGACLPKVAAVGEATAAAARDADFTVALVPETYVAESLVDALSNQSKGKKILLTRAEIARDVIPDALCTAGATVDVVDAYRNVLPESAPALLREALEQGIDAATFTSSSSVTHLAEAARAAGIVFPFPGVPAISIGPITSATLRELGWHPAVEALQSDIPSLIEGVRFVLRNF